MDVMLVTTTVETVDDAKNIARSLLEHRLMACAQITGPIMSLYKWDGEIVDGQEYLLTVKTTGSLLQEVISAIDKIHPYDVPEIIAIKPEYVSPEYAKWVHGEVEQ